MRNLPHIFEWIIAAAILLAMTIIISPRYIKAADISLRQGLQQQLAKLQLQIDTYAYEHNGEYPDLGTNAHNSWDALVGGGYITNAPLNLHVNKALVLAQKTSPELLTKDHHINQTDIGWFYNPKTGRVIANGFDHINNAFHDEKTYTPRSFAW